MTTDDEVAGGATTTRWPGPRGAAAARALRGLLTEPCAALDGLAAAHGRAFAVRAGPARLYVVGDADLVGDVLGAPVDRFRWRTAFRNLAVVTGGTSMLVSDGDDHRRRRRLAQPSFALRRVESWSGLVVREADRAIDALPVGAGVDLHEVLRAVVRRVVVRALFGDELGGRADEVGAALAPAIAYAGRPALRQLPHPLPVGGRHGARAARRRVDRLLDDEVARRRAAPAGRPGAPDVLDALLEAAAADGADDAEVRDQVVTLVAAGHDTTSAAISWLLVRALTTPGVVERLREEADAAPADPASPDRRAGLAYADAVVRESLRLHPPGPIAPRWVVRDHRVGPYAVEPRTMLVWSPYLLGRDPARWAQPTAFRPDRFLDGDAGAGAAEAAVGLAYAPFGAGPRKCIGFALAHMELQLIASRIAQRLTLAPGFTEVPPAVGMVTSRPSGGVPVTVRARRDAA